MGRPCLERGRPAIAIGAQEEERDSTMPDSEARDLDAIVDAVVAEAHIERSLILPEEIDYIRKHVLRKPMRVIHIWALGVGVVITGEYFGWNFGLPLGGPIGVLVAALIVSVLYLAWVLTLSELSVAMPFAGGPLAYGRRAVGKCFGFLMGWSMLLECFFATVGTALATGAYVAFLANPDAPDSLVATLWAVVCALAFFLIQYWGVKEQAAIMVWLTYAAIVALVWFWLAVLPGVRVEHILTRPLLPHGWSGVLGAVPFALWFLVIIETVALAAEEAHEPHVTIPRGLILAQITLAVLVVLTWFFAAGAAPYAETGRVAYPLPLVFKHVWGTGWFLAAFSTLALSGMVVSYNGMIYATSRQSFSLGRAGYLPAILGRVHPTRRTPHVSLMVWTAATIVFIAGGYFFSAVAAATAAAILISTLTAVVWYVAATCCLFVLRSKEPDMFRPYRVPIYPLNPLFVALLAVFAAYVYGWVNVGVVLPTAGLYLLALAWYYIWGRKHILPVAPEEVAARIAQQLANLQGPAVAPAPPSAGASIERLTGALMLVGLLSLVWMILRAVGVLPVLGSETTEVVIAVAIWSILFVLVSVVGFQSTRAAAAREGSASSDPGS
jgi:ethanolamine permease